MTIGGAARDAQQCPAGVLVPVGRTQTGEGRHEVNTAVVFHRMGQVVDVGRGADQACPVAQPLDGRPTHEHAAFQRIGGLAANVPGHRGQQVVGRFHRFVARVHQQEAPGAVGVLQHAGLRAQLAEQRGLLVTGNAGNGNGHLGEAGGGFAIHLAGAFHLRQHGARHAEELEQLVVPVQCVDVVEHRAAGVAGVGHVHLAAREVPDQPGVHRAEAQLAPFGLLAGAGHVVQHPLDLGGREIGIQHQTGLLLDACAVLLANLVAIFGRAAVLPDDGVVDRLTGGAVPHQRRLALVGHADGRDVGRIQPRFGQCFGQHGHLRGPDLLAVVLHPARFGEVLVERTLGHRHHLATLVEDDGTRRRGALVQGHDITGLAHRTLLLSV